jgi:hypothetical protein
MYCICRRRASSVAEHALCVTHRRAQVFREINLAQTITAQFNQILAERLQLRHGPLALRFDGGACSSSGILIGLQFVLRCDRCNGQRAMQQQGPSGELL